ncbi:MAG: polysaccharide deacetylase family protein [Deltaproteobacteria bacterium]|nr:polysaccharide deacetylase family protein [Deltaproteobacteria bacterium]
MTQFRFAIICSAIIVVSLFIQVSSFSHMRQEAPMSSNVATISPSPNNARVSRSEKEVIAPNEAGGVMIIMFHQFSKYYAGERTPDQPYTISHQHFKALLQTLYDRNFRLISLSDFANNHIAVPAGKIPVVFTFDDATAGQFHLEKKNGQLGVAPNTAVGIMEAFYEAHPDFGLEGTFFINMGLKRPLFDGAGTLYDRLTYLTGHGFELGNHTYSHVDLRRLKTEAEAVAEVGRNQQALNAVLPGYQMRSLALPFGRTPRQEWRQSIVRGEYDHVPFENSVILGVGSRPSPPPASSQFVATAVQRVRAPGRHPAPTDLNFWLRKKNTGHLYVSDGNPEVVTIPQSQFGQLSTVAIARKNQRLVVY